MSGDAEQEYFADGKFAVILAADVVVFSRLTRADEDRALAWLRALRCDLIAPTIDGHHGCIAKRTGDGSIVEFHSVRRPPLRHRSAERHGAQFRSTLSASLQRRTVKYGVAGFYFSKWGSHVGVMTL
jgi:class 3 adenylate cyclase